MQPDQDSEAAVIGGAVRGLRACLAGDVWSPRLQAWAGKC